VFPDTASVPCEVSELVKIPSVARSNAVKNDPVEVALVNDAVTAFNIEAKRLDEVALVVELFVAKKLVLVALVNTDDEPLRVENVPVVLLSVVIVEEDEVKSVIVALVIVVVARVTVPVAVRAPAVSERNVGVADTLIVEVPERLILDPAVK
jgi:hypothetical protein